MIQIGLVSAEADAAREARELEKEIRHNRLSRENDRYNNGCNNGYEDYVIPHRVSMESSNEKQRELSDARKRELDSIEMANVIELAKLAQQGVFIERTQNGYEIILTDQRKNIIIPSMQSPKPAEPDRPAVYDVPISLTLTPIDRTNIKC